MKRVLSNHDSRKSVQDDVKGTCVEQHVSKNVCEGTCAIELL